ncbi:MAG: hypothetical protein QMD03_09605 [Syntrophales bacterium]|nr:hypothetical protein [Syntrophales bacterium]
MMKKVNWWHSFAIITIFLLVAVFQGCGKKGDPIPDKVLLPKAISDLEAQRSEEGIVLRWSVEGYGTLAGFKITRSEVGEVSRSCPGCPQEYILLADLSLPDQKLTKEGNGTFSYIDSAIEPGRLYAYRVIVCNTSGGCSEASNIAQVK